MDCASEGAVHSGFVGSAFEAGFPAGKAFKTAELDAAPFAWGEFVAGLAAYPSEEAGFFAAPVEASLDFGGGFVPEAEGFGESAEVFFAEIEFEAAVAFVDVWGAIFFHGA